MMGVKKGLLFWGCLFAE